jgi:hypothetical protein
MSPTQCVVCPDVNTRPGNGQMLAFARSRRDVADRPYLHRNAKVAFAPIPGLQEIDAQLRQEFPGC